MTSYEVWTFAGIDKPEFVSDDPVEIVHWLRKRDPLNRLFNVHPKNENFNWGKMISHEFIAVYRMAAAEDIVRKAFEKGDPSGVAQELYNLYTGR